MEQRGSCCLVLLISSCSLYARCGRKTLRSVDFSAMLSALLAPITSPEQNRKAMPRALISLLCLLGIAAAPLSAYPQEVEPDRAQAKHFRETCRTDYEKFCPGGPPSISFEQACLKQRYINLSRLCRHALEGMSRGPGAESDDQ